MTENNDFNNTENERYCVRAGYWHNYTGIGRCEDENLTTNEVCDLINEQNETIQELYDFRLVYNALLFNEWAKNGKYEVYKSKRHYDGKLCFDGEWFIVVGILPTGQVTNHYPIRNWNDFKIPEYEKVKDEFDGHTSTDVLLRLSMELI